MGSGGQAHDPPSGVTWAPLTQKLVGDWGLKGAAPSLILRNVQKQPFGVHRAPGSCGLGLWALGSPEQTAQTASLDPEPISFP